MTRLHYLFAVLLLASCVAPKSELAIQRVLEQSILNVDRFLAAERAAAAVPSELRALANRLRVEFPRAHEDAARLWLAWRTGATNATTRLDLEMAVMQLSALSLQAEYAIRLLEYHTGSGSGP